MGDVSYISYVLSAIELLASIVATLHFRKYQFSTEKWFLYFLWYTFLIDTTGLILQIFSLSSFWLYNIFTISSFLFFYFWYYTVLQSKRFKNLVRLLTLFYLITVLLTNAFETLSNQGYAFFIGAIFLLLLILMHFNQLLNSNEVVIIKYKLSFWISTALLLFYIGILPLMLLGKYIDVKGEYFNVILLSLNVILYGCYIIGFIWTKQKYNRF